jgi:hypothetical protein
MEECGSLKTSDVWEGCKTSTAPGVSLGGCGLRSAARVKRVCQSEREPTSEDLSSVGTG